MTKSSKYKLLTLLIAVFIPSIVYFGIFSANQNALQGKLTINSLKTIIPSDFYDADTNFCPSYEKDFIEYLNNKSQTKKIQLIENLENLGGDFDINRLNLNANAKDTEYKLNYEEIQKLWAIHTARCNESVVDSDLLLPAIDSYLSTYEEKLNTRIIRSNQLVQYMSQILDKPVSEVEELEQVFDNAVIKTNFRNSCLIELSFNNNFGIEKNYKDDCLDATNVINFSDTLDLKFNFAEQNEVEYFSIISGLESTDVLMKDILSDDNYNPTLQDKVNVRSEVNENFNCTGECEDKYLIYIGLATDQTQLNNRASSLEPRDGAPAISTIDRTYTNPTIYILAAKKGATSDPSTDLTPITSEELKEVDITCESNSLDVETTCAFQIPVNTSIPNDLKIFIGNERPLELPTNSSNVCQQDADNQRNVICERVKTYNYEGENKISFISDETLILTNSTITLGEHSDSNKIEISRDSKVRQGEKQDIKIEFNHTKDLKFAKVLVCNSEKCDDNYKTSIFAYCHEDFSKADKACNSIEESDQLYETPETERLTLETFNLEPDDYYIIVVTYDEDENRDTKTKQFTVRPGRRGTGALKQVYPTIAACSKYFVDMLPNDPLCMQATLLRERNIFMGQEINGQRYANLSQPLNRAEFFAVSSRLYNLPNIPANPQNLARFTDLNPSILSDPNNNWWLSPLGQLSQAGIVSGYQDGTVQPFKEITQAELAKVTGLSLKLLNPMSLNPQIQPWHLPVTQQLGALGIMFNPDAKALRADAVHIISQSIIASEGSQRTIIPQQGF